VSCMGRKKTYCHVLEGTVPKTSPPPPMAFIADQIQLMAAQALELAARHWGPDPPDMRGRHSLYTNHPLPPRTSPCNRPKPPPWVLNIIAVVVILTLITMVILVGMDD